MKEKIKKILKFVDKYRWFLLVVFVAPFFVFPQVINAATCSELYGFMAMEDFLSGGCKCMSGYVFGKDFMGKTTCVSGDSVCRDKYGYNSRYDSLSGSCECSYGYILGKDTLGQTACISENQACKNQYGYNARSSYSGKCECSYGYGFGTNILGKTECISLDSICRDKYGYNSSHNSLTDSCECGSGYEMSQKSYGSGLECQSCFSKYGLHSSYNYLSKKCECDDGYTLDSNNKCVKKQNNVYFMLKELDTDERKAIIKSDYDYRYYLVSYGVGCYSFSFRRYLNNQIVVNLGTDFDLDRWDKIVLQDDDEVCDITSVERADSSTTLEPEEEDSFIYRPPVKTPTQIQKATPTPTPAPVIKENITPLKSTTPTPSETQKETPNDSGEIEEGELPTSTPESAVDEQQEPEEESQKESVTKRVINKIKSFFGKLKFW